MMDSEFFKNLEYFTVLNNQTSNQPTQAGESSAAGTARNNNEAAFWEALAGAESGYSGQSRSDRPAGSLPPFSQPSSTAPANLSYRPPPGQAFHGIPKRTTSSRAGQDTADPSGQRRDGHDKKRQKTNPDSAALESVDYWIQFDDDDADNNLGGSFEIDFSKRETNNKNSNNSSNYCNPLSRLNPLPTTPGLGTGLYTTPLFKEDDFIDDNALDNALSDEEDFMESLNLSEQLSNIDTQPPQEVPPREGLYSTPLSWEKPAPGLRMNPLFGVGTPMLDPEQRRLLAIALNAGGSASSVASRFGTGEDNHLGSEYSGLGNLGSGTGTASLSGISKDIGEQAKPKGKGKEKEKEKEEEAMKPPVLDIQTKAHRAQKAQASKASASAASKGKDKVKGGDRTAHNDIERKYRTNLKDKIAELRDAVPSLHSIAEEGEEEEEEENNRSAPKASKGTILLKATEYIQQLEKRNQAIMKDHQDLARRLQAFEQLLTATARQPFPMPNYSRALFDPRGFC